MMSLLRILRRPHWLIVILVGISVVGISEYNSPSSAQAAETVIIVSQTVYCDRIDVTYEVIAAFPTDTAILTAYSGNTQVGSTTGTGTPSGTYSATVPVNPAQPPGTPLYAVVEINNGSGFSVNAVGSPMGCYSEGGNTEPPGGESPPPWGGYTDGRINPDPAEYYTLYCHEGTDTLYIVRTVPETETVKEVPLNNIIALEIGASMDLGDFMSLVRYTEDTITVYGSNGNLAPLAGSKSFSLAECIQRNGGTPDPDVAPPPDEGEEDEETEAEQQRRRRQQAEEELEFCFRASAFLEDSWILAGCLNDTLTDYRDVLTGEEISSLIVMIFCLNIIVGAGIVPIGIVIYQRNRRKP